MKRGRPFKKIRWDDIDNIPIGLSYNQIKYLLIKFRNFRTDSEEGKICDQIIRDFRKALVKRIKKGNVPAELEYYLRSQQKEQDEQTNVKDTNSNSKPIQQQ